MKNKVFCPYCGHDVKLNKRATCKYCKLKIVFDDHETTLGEANKAIIILEK